MTKINKKLQKKIEKRLQYSSLCLPFREDLKKSLPSYENTSLKILTKKIFRRLIQDPEIRVKGGTPRHPSFLFYKIVKHGDLEVEIPVLKLF